MQQFKVGSCRGSVGGVVASDARGPRFESSHRQTFILDIYLFVYCQLYQKDENKEKEAGYGPLKNHLTHWGSGCGSIGRAVASDSRGPQFESSHRRKFTVNCLEKTKIKKKRSGIPHFKNI